MIYLFHKYLKLRNICRGAYSVLNKLKDTPFLFVLARGCEVWYTTLQRFTRYFSENFALSLLQFDWPLLYPILFLPALRFRRLVNRHLVTYGGLDPGRAFITTRSSLLFDGFKLADLFIASKETCFVAKTKSFCYSLGNRSFFFRLHVLKKCVIDRDISTLLIWPSQLRIWALPFRERLLLQRPNTLTTNMTHLCYTKSTVYATSVLLDHYQNLA